MLRYFTCKSGRDMNKKTITNVIIIIGSTALGGPSPPLEVS
jgi:hypothetical protein